VTGMNLIGGSTRFQIAESLVEAGKDVAVIPFAEHLVLPSPDQNIGLESVIDASNDHGEPWF
jgi:hypothetical protein